MSFDCPSDEMLVATVVFYLVGFFSAVFFNHARQGRKGGQK